MKASIEILQPKGIFSILLWGVFSVAMAAAAAADEPPLPLGGELVVPDMIEGDQVAPDLASSADGGFVVVWQSHGEDGDEFGIRAKAHGPDGAELGPVIEVNTETAGSQTRPAVSAADDGRFAIAWQGPDGESTTGVFVRAFLASGAAKTGEIAAGASPAGQRTAPSVAMSEAGTFLVVWQSDDDTGRGIWARLFGDDGAPLTGELAVSTIGGGHRQNPQVRAVDETGGFLVVWEGPDASGSGIFLRHLGADGSFASGEVPVNEATAGNQRNPSLAVSGLDQDPLDRNVFVVVWQSPDAGGAGIFARAYHDDGVPLGGQQRISEHNDNRQQDPAVTVDNGLAPGGMNFVVTWTEAPVAGLAGSEEHPVVIHGRRLANVADSSTLAGALSADVFEVSEDGYSTGASVVAAEDDGDFVVIWQSDDQDGSGGGIMGRRFAGQPLFVDGFEGGDTSRWSETF